jgi:hypothetical protein
MRLKAPNSAGDGVFIGGGFHPVVDGHIEVADDGDWSILFAIGYTKAEESAAEAAPTEDHEAE